jgi:hypothetical protein
LYGGGDRDEELCNKQIFSRVDMAQISYDFATFPFLRMSQIIIFFTKMYPRIRINRLFNMGIDLLALTRSATNKYTGGLPN